LYDGVEGVGDGFVGYAAGDEVMVVVGDALGESTGTEVCSFEEGDGGG
jgi:hypothetical protein